MLKKTKAISFILALVLLFAVLPTQGLMAGETIYHGEGFELQYKVTSKWIGAQNIQMTLKNTGSSAIQNWAVGFYASGSAESPWSAAVGTGSEGYCVIENAGWNAKIAGGGSVTFGFTLNSDETFNPEVFYIGDEARNPPVTPDVELSTNPLDLGDIENLIAAGAIEICQNEDITIRSIIGAFSGIKVYNETDAAKVFNQVAGLLGSSSDIAAASEITKQTAEKVGNGDITEHFYRLNKKINGVSVLGSGIVLSTDDNGVPTGLFSTYDNRIRSVNTTTTVTETVAKAKAYTEIQNSLQADYDILPDGFMDALVCESELIIYAVDEDSQPALAWRMVVYSPEYDEDEYDEDDFIEIEVESGSILPDVSMTYYIYANGTNAGKVLLAASNLVGAEWKTINTMTMVSPDLSQTLTRQQEYNFINRPKNKFRLFDSDRKIYAYYAKTSKTNIEDAYNKAASVQTNMAKTYDYYKDKLDRAPYDEKISTDITVRIKKNLDNAYWNKNKKEFEFGEIGNREKAFDVVAHEYTHAVIDYTAKFFYDDFEAESSALHEAYADIMGSLIEGKAGDARWEFGEDANTASRSMKNPTNSKYDAAGKLYLDDYSNYSRNPDYVYDNYINSTIFSHAAYKMMSDSRTIGRSTTIWAKVFYNSLGRLNGSSRFLDARMAVLSAAKELGFTSNQQQAIKEAFDAVGITEPASIRIVLRWDSTPRDLDSHLTGPSAVTGGSRFHTWYSRRNYYQDGTTSSTTAKLAADLDYDVVSGYGPEVTTIRKLTPGTYKFYVHNFGGVSGSTNLARSGATVEIYWGTSSTPMQYSTDISNPNAPKKEAVFSPDGASAGIYWNVFTLTIVPDASGIGQTVRDRISITPVNTYGNIAPAA